MNYPHLSRSKDRQLSPIDSVASLNLEQLLVKRNCQGTRQLTPYEPIPSYLILSPAFEWSTKEVQYHWVAKSVGES